MCSNPLSFEAPPNKTLNRSGGWARNLTLQVAGRRPVSSLVIPEVHRSTGVLRMGNSQFKIIGVLAFMVAAQNLGLAQIASKRSYDYRQSAEFRDLDGTSRAKLVQLVKDFNTLETALNRFMSDHQGQPPESLGELVPDYLTSLPKDPFADSDAEIHREWNNYKHSLDGAGYLYQRRPGPAYVTSWEEPIKMQTLDGSWKVRSVGLPSFPLRYASENGRGLLRAKGYWGRMVLDVF